MPFVSAHYRRRRGFYRPDESSITRDPQVRTRLENLTHYSDKLNTWGRTFVADVLKKCKRSGYVTNKQLAAIVKLEEQVAAAANGSSTETQKLIKRIEAVQAKLAPSDSWAREFTASIHEQASNRGYLSSKQIAAFERTEQQYSPAAQAERAKWVQEFESKHRADWDAVIAYYRADGQYYQQAVERAANPRYVPSRREFSKVADNKYARRVLASTNDEPLYARGDLVRARDGVSPYRSNVMPRAIYLVVDNHNVAAPAACKGGRKYRVVEVGSSIPIVTEERWLKSIKRTRKVKK